MQFDTTTDTIAAIATPPGVGGIGVIRVSGPEAFDVVLPLLKLAGGSRKVPPSHQLTFARVVDPQTRETVDETLVAFMRPPRTYTREPVVEIQGHGGPRVYVHLAPRAGAGGAHGESWRIYPACLFERTARPRAGRGGDGPDWLADRGRAAAGHTAVERARLRAGAGGT